MIIPQHVAEVLDDLFGTEVTFTNWADVAALGAKLVELGQKLQAQAKEAENPVCVGTGTESCWRPRLVLVWVDPLKFAGGVSDIIGFLNCSDLEAIGIWHWVNNQREFVIPTIPKDLEERGSWDKDGVFTQRSGTLRLRLSNPGETLAIRG